MITTDDDEGIQTAALWMCAFIVNIASSIAKNWPLCNSREKTHSSGSNRRYRDLGGQIVWTESVCCAFFLAPVRGEDICVFTVSCRKLWLVCVLHKEREEKSMCVVGLCVCVYNVMRSPEVSAHAR